MIALGMACFGVIGPGLFDLPPPKYFAPHSIVVEDGGSGQNSESPLVISADRSTELSVSLPKKTAEHSKDSEVPGTDLALDIDDAGKKEQVDIPEIEQKSSEIVRLDNTIPGDMAQFSRPAKPAKPAKTKEGSDTVGVELKPTAQAVRVAPLLVPREFVEKIPTLHQSLSGSAQKASFFKIALPLILAGNEEVMRRRDAISRANQNGDRVELEKWAHLYDIKIVNQDNDILTRQLLRRADVIPVPIALAQAAVESGWGTSRFAMQGNALFGQWAWRDDAGLRPLAASNDRAVVRSFSTLLGSVRAYIHNLNTHPYYQDFRNTRAKLYDGPKEKKTKILVKYLDRYAQIGPAYVTKLENLIRTNNFGRFALAYLT